MTTGLLVAAPRSGAGKTTVTLGLLRALARTGLAVQSYKCGPDYIDPAFHAAATGRPSYNLDLWAMGPDRVRGLVAATSRDAGIAIAEGVMGLFDGAAAEGPYGRGASADVAACLGWPVVLVLDVSGQTETAAAVALGCKLFRPDIELAGVILNRVASPRHERLVRAGLARIGLPVLGALPRDDTIVLPERHLGLVQAEETAGLDRVLDRMADAVARGVDLAALRRLAQSPCFWSGGSNSLSSQGGERVRGEGQRLAQIREQPPGSTPVAAMPFPMAALHPDAPPVPLCATERGDLSTFLRPPGQRVALARDAAFSFVYPHVLRDWRCRGAEIIPFSPLADEPPDASADAVWLPGGYPELHAGRLAANHRFRQGLFAAATRGTVIHGECGGYMALGRGLEDVDGNRHEMVGLLGLETSFARRRLHLGYRRATLRADGALGTRGTALVGHEFHYAAVLASPDEPLADVKDAEGAVVAEAGAQRGRVSGTFFHVVAVGDRGSP